MLKPRSLSSTPGILLAGTFPWANSPFERLAPRPLMPLAHRPLFGFALGWLLNAGVTRVVVCGNRHSRALEAQLSRETGAFDLTYREDAMPRGAAGCVRDAADGCAGDAFIVADASAIPTLDLHDLLETHYASGAAATMAVYGESRGAGHAPMQVPAGVYVLDRRVVESIGRHGFIDIKEQLVPQLARAGERVATFTIGAAVPRVLNAGTYLAVNDIVTQNTTSARVVLAGYEQRGEALVHHDAVVESDVIMAGPVIVAAGARIGSRAVLVGPTSVGCDADVGAGALVSRSAVWRRSRIGANAVVDRSIIGDDGLVSPDRRVYKAVVASEARRSATAVPAGVPATSLSPRSAA